MNENLMLIASPVVGMLLGAFFFGGLWWTVKKGLASEWPAVWFLGSLCCRTVVVLGGFYLISGGSSLRLALSLAGFVIARSVITSRCRRTWAVEGLHSQPEVQRAHQF